MLSDSEIAALKTRTQEIIRQENPEDHQTKFLTNVSSRDESFISSGDKIKLFLEPDQKDVA